MSKNYNSYRKLLRREVCFKRRRVSGFTLIELLTVIAIIGILAAILIPVVARVRLAADRAVATSNLRSIGQAIALYVDDHDGFLPGPVLRGQQAIYAEGNPGSLLTKIGTYMGLGSPPPEEPMFVEAFSDPGWQKGEDTHETVVWWLNMEAEVEGLPRRREPWGYPHQSAPANDPRLAPIPHGDITDPTMQMAMQSVDAQLHTWPGVPEEPVYGNVRLRLYFDWHVGTVPIEAEREIFWPPR